MEEKFFNLDTEKQMRIINAAIKEFSQKGYDKASTNEMVKEAGISKGLLFHYFQNKKQLFLFLFDYCIQAIEEAFYKKLDLTETDFFVRIRQAVIIKTELMDKYPEILKFIERAVLEETPEIKAELAAKIKELNQINFAKIYDGIDLSKFREDMDIEKVLKIITYTFEKISEEELQRGKSQPIDYKRVNQVAEEYFELLTKAFYK